MTATIATDDVRKIVRLLGEVAILNGDIPLKRRHLVTGLAALVGADVWVWSLARLEQAGAPAAIYWILDGGWVSEDQRTLSFRSNFAPESREIGAIVLKPQPHHRTRTRRQLLTDDAWYGSGFYQAFRMPADLDDFMYSLYPLGGGVESSISLHRRVGEPAFSDRDRCIVHVITSEIDWLHRSGSDVPGVKTLVQLSPRLREVLLMLLTGDSRKQVAFKLGLSEHTVGDYMKALHKHFDVNSRGELLAKFMQGGALPALA